MSERIPLTVVVSTFNNGATLRCTLDSVAWADEIIVHDSDSWDDTLAVAKPFHCKLSEASPQQPGQAWETILRTAGNEWILCIDGDQYISSALTQEILQAISSQSSSRHFTLGTDIDAINSVMMLPKVGRTRNNHLFHRNVHYTLSEDGSLRFEGLNQSLIHRLESCPVDSIEQWIAKMNERTSSDVEKGNVRESTMLYILRLPTALVNGFIRMFIGKRFYRNGIRGFIYAAFHGIYRLSFEAKRWEYRMRMQEKKGNLPPVTNAAIRVYHHK
jgi:glycosyltransferase involved in cell wall biosynthesis